MCIIIVQNFEFIFPFFFFFIIPSAGHRNVATWSAGEEIFDRVFIGVLILFVKRANSRNSRDHFRCHDVNQQLLCVARRIR